jgi:glycine cleavage system H protein
VTGTVIERNAQLEERPELVNESPYGEGWIVAIEVKAGSELESLLDAAGYRGFVEESGQAEA